MAQWINHVYTHQNFLINCAIDQVQWSLSTSVFFPVENSMGLKYLINMFSSEKHKMFCERAQNKFISENYPASFFFFFFCPSGIWDLSSLTRDWTHAFCSVSLESQSLDCKGTPPHLVCTVLTAARNWVVWDMIFSFQDTRAWSAKECGKFCINWYSGYCVCHLHFYPSSPLVSEASFCLQFTAKHGCLLLSVALAPGPHSQWLVERGMLRPWPSFNHSKQSEVSS